MDTDGYGVNSDGYLVDANGYLVQGPDGGAQAGAAGAGAGLAGSTGGYGGYAVNRDGVTALRGALLTHQMAGPAQSCSPRHRLPFNFQYEGVKCVSMMWRATSARQVSKWHPMTWRAISCWPVQVAVTHPAWPALASYGVWRQARGSTQEQTARLLGACTDVKTAAEMLGLGGSCHPTKEGTAAGTVEAGFLHALTCQSVFS